MQKILEGKTLRDAILATIQDKITSLPRPPKLCVILVGDNPASKTYVGAKEKACLSVGMDFDRLEFPETISENELIACIQKINNDDGIDGCIVQLPLPKHIRTEVVINTLKSTKDVDGFTRENIGKLYLGENTGHISCTPKGIMRLFAHYEIPLSGKNVVVIGRSTIVGRPLGLLLQHAGATVTTCHSKTNNIGFHTRNADIVISAVGKNQFITADMIQEGAIVIDVGINRNEQGKLVGDVDFEMIIKKADCTPVPGGIGPMTIAMIIENTLAAYLAHQ